MQQKTNSNSIYTPELEMISDIVSRVSNLFYEMMFILDLNNQTLTYISPKSGLSKTLLSKENRLLKFIDLTTELGYSDNRKLSQLMEAIKCFYDRAENANRKNLLFISDIPLSNNNQYHKSTYKFSPLTENADGSLRHIIGTISLSSGTIRNALHVIDLSMLERSHFDFELNRWCNLNVPPLSKIEWDILVLSAEGLSVPEISEIVCRAQDSVKSIRKRIFEKLGARNITEAIIYATNYKII